MQQFLTLPNLLSLSRVALAPIVLYFLRGEDQLSVLICLILLILAGITDALDGYVARRRKSASSLGILIDPVADKLFAAVLVVGIILYRDFPIWLAASILSRDILILAGGLLLMRGEKQPLPSNLLGKYTFAIMTLLIASHIVRFEFGITLTTIATVALLALSMGAYARLYIHIRKGLPAPRFNDTTTVRAIRVSLTVLLAAYYSYRLYTDMISTML